MFCLALIGIFTAERELVQQGSKKFRRPRREIYAAEGNIVSNYREIVHNSPVSPRSTLLELRSLYYLAITRAGPFALIILHRPRNRVALVRFCR